MTASVSTNRVRAVARRRGFPNTPLLPVPETRRGRVAPIARSNALFGEASVLGQTLLPTAAPNRPCPRIHSIYGDSSANHSARTVPQVCSTSPIASK